MTAPRFFFVTNDLPRAALEFWCHPGNLPAWLAVLDNPDDWLRIPDGSKCLGLWYGSAAEVEGWRNFWAIREGRGGIVGVAPEELNTIMAWCETHRRAPSRTLLYASEGTAADMQPSAPSPAANNESSPEKTVAEAKAPVKRRAMPSRGDALGPSQPRIDPVDRSAPSAMSRVSKWI